MARDPRIPEHFSDDVADHITKGQAFRHRGAVLRYKKTSRTRGPTGTFYLAKFTVLQPDPDQEWITGPYYFQSEYLVAAAISSGQMEPIDDEAVIAPEQLNITEL
jgi:hypothetical protein